MKEKSELEWVRSHQDDDQVSELDQASQLNIKADGSKISTDDGVVLHY